MHRLMFKRYFWARNRLKTLQSGKDTKEIIHLLLEVRYGSPILQHTSFSITFAQQAAIPSIARMLYRNGKGQIFINPTKRVNDTWIYFGELFHHFDDDTGKKVIRQINMAHQHFPIPNHLNLYTLATMICIPQRMGIEFSGTDVLSKDQFKAIFLFWKRIGELMGIKDIPRDEYALLDWCKNYEKENYEFTAAGQKVTMALANEFSRRWFPLFLQGLGQQVFYCLLNDELMATHQIPKPNSFLAWMVRLFLLIQIRIVIPILPDPKDRRIKDFFGKEYPYINIQDIGYHV